MKCCAYSTNVYPVAISPAPCDSIICFTQKTPTVSIPFIRNFGWIKCNPYHVNAVIVVHNGNSIHSFNKCFGSLTTDTFISKMRLDMFQQILTHNTFWFHQLKTESGINFEMMNFRFYTHRFLALHATYCAVGLLVCASEFPIWT